MHRPGLEWSGLSQIMPTLGAGLQDFASFHSSLSNFVVDSASHFLVVKVTHTTMLKNGSMFRSRLGSFKITKEGVSCNWNAIAMFRFDDANEKIVEEWVQRDEVDMIKQVASVTLSPLWIIDNLKYVKGVDLAIDEVWICHL